MAIGNKFSSELEDFFKFTIRVSLVLMVGYVIAGAVLLVILGIYSLFMAITSSISVSYTHLTLPTILLV